MYANSKTVFLLAIIIFFGVACAKKTEPAYISINPHKPSQKVLARDSHDSETQFNKLIISVFLRDETPVASLDVANLESTSTIKVPTQTPLLVTAQGFVNNELSYKGQTDVNALSAGQRENIRLILYEIDLENEPVPVDLSIDNKPLNSIGWQFSRDSQYILFSADNELYVKSLSNQTITNINTDIEGQSVNENSLVQEEFGLGFDISADGYYAVFASNSTNFGFNDTNGVSDVFLKNIKNNEILLISSTEDGLPLNTASIRPHISDDGSRISYLQNSQTFIADNFESSESFTIGDLVLYDRFSRTSTEIRTKVIDYVLSGDGTSIVYTTTNQNGLFFYDIDNKNEIQITDTAEKYLFNISQNGQRVLYLSFADNSPLKLFNSQTSNQLILSNIDGVLNDISFTNLPAISNDGRYAAFINNNALFIKDTEYNNTLQILDNISIDSGPFISAEGTKIGYSLNGQVFLLDNPLFITAQTPLLKASAPTGMNASSVNNTVEVSWDSVETANYYRIYVSTTSDITSQLDNSSFLPRIYETRDLELSISENLVDNETLYFVVTAINDKGEGLYSEEFNTLVSFDVTPPTVSNINPTNNELDVPTNSAIIINYSESIDTSTVNQNNIELFDSLANSLPLNITHNGSVTTIQPISILLNNETYRLELSNNITDLSGNPLSEDFSSSFTSYAFKNEGTLSTPLDIATGLPLTFSGEVAANGKSYYRIPALDINKTYFISLNSSQPDVTYSVSSFSFDFTSDNPDCANSSDICVVSPIEVGELYLEVDGSKTARGAEYRIEVQEAVTYNGNGEIDPLSLTFTNQNTQVPVVINNSTESNNFALFFSPSEAGTLQVTSLNDSIIICNIDTSLSINTQAACELPANGGKLPILIEYTSSNASVNISMTSQEFFEIPVTLLPNTLFVGASGNTNYKITGLSPDSFFALNFQATSGDTKIDAYDDAWQQNVCSETVGGQVISKDCLFYPSSSDAVYLTLESFTVDNQSSSVEISYLPYTFINASFLTDSSFSLDSEIVLYQMTELEPNTLYQVTVTPEEKFGNGALISLSNSSDTVNCIQLHNSEPVTCEILSDENGIILFSYSNNYFFEVGSFISHLNVLPIEPISLLVNTSTQSQISPIKYFVANQLTENAPHIVEMNVTQKEVDLMQPFLRITDENWKNKLCDAFFTAGDIHSCVVNASALGNINVMAGDNIPIVGPTPLPVPTIADITVKTIPTTFVDATAVEKPISFEVPASGIFLYQINNINAGSAYDIQHNSPVSIEVYKTQIIKSSDLICSSMPTESTTFNQRCDVIGLTPSAESFVIIVNTLAEANPSVVEIIEFQLQ